MKLLIGGSPCTHWSIAQTKNRETEPKGLGWELFKNYLIARDKFQPDYFLYENNKSMSAAIREQISRELDVGPILINSALVSAQNRQRLYWTNIPGVVQPEDRGILLRDILESGTCWREKAYTLRAAIGSHGGPSSALKTIKEPGKFTFNGAAEPIRVGTIKEQGADTGKDSRPHRVYSADGKSVTLINTNGGMGSATGLYTVPCAERIVGRRINADGHRDDYNENPDKINCLTTVQKDNMVAVLVRVGDMPNAAGKISGSQSGRIYSVEAKGVPLQARQNGGCADGAATGLYAVPAAEGKKALPVYAVRSGLITIKGKQYPIKLADGFYIIRKLTVPECKRLQTVPDSYMFPVSDTQAYKMLGNGWTVDVIAHILGYASGITSEPLEVLSMYDGMSCGHIALDRLGASISHYWATEIDKYAIKTTQHNFPDVVQLGDAFQVREAGWRLPR